MEESESIAKYSDEIAAALENFKTLVKKVRDLVPNTNPDLIKRL